MFLLDEEGGQIWRWWVVVEANEAGFWLLFWPLLLRERLVCVQLREGSGCLLAVVKVGTAVEEGDERLWF